MFTGLIEAVGHVAEVTPASSGFRIRIRTSLSGELRVGDSLAVNGVCLTVTAADGATVDADIGPETVRVTTLGQLKPKHPVNLERSMPANGRFGGHIVQGHVDGVGKVLALERGERSAELVVEAPAALARYLVEKGSIALDGVSLTVASLRGRAFSVALIPYTLERTSLHAARPGARVNLEADVIAKYVERLLGSSPRPRRSKRASVGRKPR
jgi:riboflavin synthase